MRIRTVKPEWLEDEKLAAASDEARVLSIALILMSDDHGRGRASVATIAAEAWRYALERNDGRDAPEVLARASRALRELVEVGFVVLYEVKGQRYFAIPNWTKHQKVDRPSAPRVPPPEAQETSEKADIRETLATPSRDTRDTLATDPDPDPDLYPDPDPRETPVVAVAAPRPRDPSQLVDHLVNGPATPALAWRLMEAVAEAYPGPDGRPIAIPGVVHSANDLTKLGMLLDASGEQPMMLLACEWLALLSLIASGETDRPRGPMIPYFSSRYGRLEDDRIAAGVPFPPARIAPKAPSRPVEAVNAAGRHTEAPEIERAVTGQLGALRDALAKGAA